MSTPTEIGGRYRLDRRLGAGGMSTVFLAVDTVLEREVAVKLLAEHLADDEVFVMRFRHEALAAARLQHPNIVQVFDSGNDEPSHRHYIVMEYVDGPSCSDLLREHGELGIEDTVRIVVEACHGLDYAHRAGVIHRDVKPGNLLISNETGAVKLADFGIAKAAEQTRVTQVGSVLGTAAYLSPEQAQGKEAGAASDIYSLGVCAYQLLTGRLPYEYSSLTELALKQQNEGFEPLRRYRREVPDELDRAVQVCLSRDPEARYGSALELAEALEAGMGGEVTQTTRRLESYHADADATQALARTTAIPAESVPDHLMPDRTQAIPPTRRRATAAPPPRAAARRGAARRRWGNFVAGLAILAAGALVALAILQASGSGNQNSVNESNVHDQAQGLESLIRDNQR
ncbi:MAG: eukaryotic-like serine/threonine-protein kinase [Thermoleophilaceae bacterium]|nr:eukaryotic-like serine/threonine-protein kinase [Thermoleophilaceae bacterium]